MLIEFSVANYLSFREKTTLSMVASKDKSLPGNVISEVEGFNLPLLKSVVVYGANASGKSNLIKAMAFMSELIQNSALKSQAGDLIGRVPFKLCGECADKPSEFEVVFLHEGVRYVYGFAVSEKRVVEEYLSHYPKGRSAAVFERTFDPKNGEYEYHIGRGWGKELSDLKGKTRENALFLSVGAQWNSEICRTVVKWARDFFRLLPILGQLGAMGFVEYTAGLIADYDEARVSVSDFVRKADTGIRDLAVEERPIREMEMFRDTSGDFQEKVIQDLPKDAKSHKVATMHSAVDETGECFSARFELEEESDGTRKVLALAGPWLTMLKSGMTLCLDEFDLHLHPNLCRWLVRMLHDPESNDKNAQVILTTHNSDLLDLKMFRRDQIWFTEKNPAGATELYSLYDYKEGEPRKNGKPRKDENVRKRYLMGRYGAVPVLGDLS